MGTQQGVKLVLLSARAGAEQASTTVSTAARESPKH